MSSYRRRIALVMRASWAGAGLRFPLTTLGIVGSYVAGVVNAALLRSAIDAAAQHDYNHALRVLIGAALLDAVVFAGMKATARLGNEVQEHTRQWFDREVVRLAMSSPGLAHYETPEFLDRLELIRTQPAPLAQAYIVFNNFLAIGIQAVLMAGLLISIDARLVGVALLAIPLIIAIIKTEEVDARAWDRVAHRGRLSWELFVTGTSPQSPAEVHTLGLHEMLIEETHSARRDVRKEMRRANTIGILVSAGASAISALVLGVGLIVVTHRAISGSASLGDVALAISLTGLVSRQVVVSTEMISRFGRSMRLLDEFLWLNDFVDSQRDRHRPNVAVPNALQGGVSLSGVSFKYAHAERDAVHELTLDLHPGEVVALIGENGAGKTTVVKLLTGMYEPTAGEVVVDGTPLRDHDLDAWRERISAAFQDFARFELTAGETIGVGHLPSIDDNTRVAAALDNAGGTDVLAALDHGLATELGRSFTNGRELSGGQWQKLALGRTMMRPAPLLLIFDEPTASLDALAEHALFSRYAAQARAMAAEVAAITVLVSHRFSTVRMADRIVVLRDGQIAEQGTHDALIAADGLYAELYKLQAASYQ